MASPTLPAILLAFLFLAAPGAVAFDEHVVDGDDGHFLLLDCGRGSGAAASKNSSSSAAADLAHLLAALPSVAAPEGSAVLSRGGASVHGVCIGNDSSPEACRACLAAAARNLTLACGGPTGRRGGAWSDGCFVAYYAVAADAAVAPDDRRKVVCHGELPLSYLDDNDRGGDLFLANYDYWTAPDPTVVRLLLDLAQRAADEPARMLATGERRSEYSYDGMTVRALAQCTGAAPAAEDCLRCLKGAAYQAVLSCGGAGSGWLRGGRVLTYGCYMQFEVSYRCGDPLQLADEGAIRRSNCSSAAAARASGGGAFLRWLTGASLVAAVLLHGPRGM